MGIPRLTQDIAPYAESITFGDRGRYLESDCIDKVVIDGPSLVYHVYSLLLKQYRNGLLSQSDRSRVSRDVLFSYSAVTDAVRDFLELLKEAGVIVLRIFFDGGLPLNKKSTRLERLERVRQQLENYRLLNPRNPLVETPKRPLGFRSVDQTLWESSSSTGPTSTLPLPPFIVPSVIEDLLLDVAYSNITEIVDGESDAYCAGLAAQHGAAVLSNDSDLIVHDLGKHGCLVSLHSIHLIRNQDGSGTLSGLCLRSARVASGLGIANLQLYAYQRAIDGQATSRVIVQRTRAFDVSNGSERSAYQKFLQSYQNLISNPSQKCGIQSRLSVLDPRTAELVCSIDAHTPLCVYLPVLFEDPSRDSSWAYGIDLRQLAYSVIIHCSDADIGTSEGGEVTEYSRRGRAIKSCAIMVLSYRQTVERIDDLVGNLQQSCVEATDGRNLLNLFSFAAQIVQALKIHDAKSCITQICRLMSVKQGSSSRPTWDDVHILANIQAVLYSLRMLKQICSYVGFDTTLKSQLAGRAHMLREILSKMPAIKEIFLDINQLQKTLRNVPISARNEQIRKIETMQGPKDASARDDNSSKSQDAVLTNKSLRHEPTTVKQKRPAEDSVASSLDKDTKRKHPQSTHFSSNNPFGLLSD